MIKICLVGEIGSGKTHIARLLAGSKYPLFNADQEVANIYSTSKLVFLKLKKLFPRFILTFPTDKAELSKLILSNKKNLKKIIKIIHPEVRKKMNLFLKKNKKKKVVILDIPLLLENKLHEPEDVIVYINPHKKLLHHHLKKRSGYNKKIVDLLKEIQLSPEDKKIQADIIFDNNFNLKKTRLRAKQILDSIII